MSWVPLYRPTNSSRGEAVLRFAFIFALVICSAISDGEPVRCAKGQETIYQNAPCPAGYSASGLSPSLSVIEAQRPRFDHVEDKRGMVGRYKAHIHTPRDQKKVRQFLALFPCPSTLEETGPCTGWVVDHKIPLACAGPDDYRNMQWQTALDAKAKDRIELRCDR